MSDRCSRQSDRCRGFILFAALGFAAACSAAPVPADAPPAGPAPPSRADVSDECAQQPGKPPPAPLKHEYNGVAKKARCDREIFTIMGGVTHFLGVKCNYCHIEPDYPRMTHRKQIANWMARELIPSLQKKGGGDAAESSKQGETWCNDCHLVNGRGTAKILGNPRNPKWAVEWMTTHLVEDFDSADGKNLRCKSCHVGNPGTPEFQRKVILTDRLPTKRASPADPETPTPAPAAGPSANP
jgi:hypothetical protein